MDILRDDHEKLLFSDRNLSDVLRANMERVKQSVESVAQQALLSASLDDLIERVASEHKVDALTLFTEDADVEKMESPMSSDRLSRSRRIPGDQPVMVPGFTVAYHVPFEGDNTLFHLRPNTYSMNPPRGVVRGNELVMTYWSREIGEHLGREFESNIKDVRTNIGHQAALIERHNEAVVVQARRFLSERIDRLLRADAGVAMLGVPLRRRPDAPTTYAAPEVRRRLPTAVPSGTKARVSKVAPEPVLPDAEYLHILRVMRNMALVLERSPSAFTEIGEEGIRWHFIVQLNAQYEGQATGETFNFSGKTDILVRSGDRNIFIAECKFWKGPKSFIDTVDQLLRYLTWRDTKAAILVFNRDAQLSTVLSAVPEAMKKHPACGGICRDEETMFSATLSRPDDSDRKIKLTVMVFDVPKRQKEPSGL